MSDSTRSSRYRVNEPSVIHQAIDGELVIIHLDHGIYYSLDATGARIWAALAAGQPPASVSDAIARDVGGQDEKVAEAVDALVDRLRDEDLLVPLGDAEAAPTTTASRDSDNRKVETEIKVDRTVPFETPVLQRYEDLQDLLLLDPIHAVDESGWPDRRDDA